jgi:hypothetical protein
MASGRKTPYGQRTALGHCPRCTSRLIHTVDSVWLDREVILDRRCPECEYRESVVVSALGATARYRKDTHTMLGMRLLADALEHIPKDGQGRPAA